MRSRLFVNSIARVMLAPLGLLLVATLAHGTDTYDPVSKRLSIPAITIGRATYSNVVLTVGSILSRPAGGVPLGGVDTFDPSTGRLTVAAVSLGGTVYSNVIVSVTGVVAIGGVTGADIYDGVNLAIPSVSLGSVVYHDVVVTVSGIISRGGGIPASALDQYDPVKKWLTVSAALDQVHGQVYTNAIVTVGRIVSVGGVANSAELVAEHSVAQAGLSVGLVSTVMQSQLELIKGFSGSVTPCQPLPGSNGGVLSGASPGSVTVYYDSACSRPYVSTIGSIAAGASSSVALISETASYQDAAGTAIGELALNESLQLDLNFPASSQLNGLGIFTPATGVRTPVQLGVYCTVPLVANASPEVLSCEGGVAQDFPALGISIGVILPITLVVNSTSGSAVIGAPMTFSGTGITTSTGPLGSLTLTAPTTTTLAISGGTPSATYSLTGGAAAFSLFPATPTSWTLTDSFSELQVQVTVADNTTRNLTLVITQGAGGATVATGAIDQSGTGTMTFSSGRQEPVVNWTLGSASS